MSSAPAILAYLADCYRENGSRLGTLSLESSRVRQSLVVDGEDPVVSASLLEGQYFIPGKRAASLANQARLHEKDRDFFFGSLFLIGNVVGSDGRQRMAYAPLIWYSVSVSQVTGDSGAEFLIDTSRRQLNYALLECLGDDEFVEGVEGAVDASTHTEGCVGELRRGLAKAVPELQTDSLLNYPALFSSRKMRAIFTASEKDGSLHLVPGAALFLSNKSTEMRGVLNDLEAMSSPGARLTAPVETMLSAAEPEGKGSLSARRSKATSSMPGYIPACLSVAQERIAGLAGHSALTLVVGPPGTGKSFTIAALAIEAMSRGESVLIASRMDHAVDVVADKIEQSLGLPGVCVRAGRRSYLQELKKFLDDLLSGLYFEDGVSKAGLKKASRDLERLSREITRAERDLEKRCRREERHGVLLSRSSPGAWTRWRQSRIRKRAASTPSTAALAAEVTKLIDQRIADTVAYLKLARSYFLQEALEKHRASFQSFSRGVRARTTHKKEEYFDAVSWSGLLRALPVWLVNLSDLHRVIPDRRELFDLVIIDEASQCDIASALPALQRAKRAVISGDPKQLRHVSFLPVARQRELARLHGLGEEEARRYDFRHVSLADLASAAIRQQDHVIFLNEHFRSRPPIIQFSNTEFYAKRLAIMTGHREVDRHSRPAVSLYPLGGERGENGVNETEIDALMEQVDALAADAADGSTPLSIGILSPFRAQVDSILKRIERSPLAGVLLQRHALLAGTAHSFQGEERDIMFLSFALDENSPAASFRFLEKEDVFNVAITRARLENRVFVSFAASKRGQRLAGRYLRYLERQGGGVGEEKTLSEEADSTGLDGTVMGVEPTRPTGSGEVRARLKERGVAVEEAFEIGGYTLDFLCHRGERSLGVDLIGFPGPFADAMSLDRHLLFRRAGIRLYPVSLGEWQADHDAVLDGIENWLGVAG